VASSSFDDSSEVSDKEFLLRKVPRDRYSPGDTQRCSPTAFYPTRYDNDGISIVREAFTGVDELVRIFEHKNPFYVVRLNAGEIRQRGITVLAAPSRGGIKGHAVVPEISFYAWQTDDTRVRELAMALSILASHEAALMFVHPELENSG